MKWVGRVVHLVERQVALAADGHAQGAVAEHLDADALTRRAADILLADVAVDFRYLLQIQFTRQHNHIGKLGIEAQGLDITDVELGAEVYFLPYLAGVGHHGHVGGDDGRDAGLLGGTHDGTHQGDVLVVDDGVHGEVALHAVLVARTGYFAQVVDGERIGRTGTHVQVLDAEVDGVCSGLYGSGQRLARADGGHYLKIFQFHIDCSIYSRCHSCCSPLPSAACTRNSSSNSGVMINPQRL